MHLPARDSNFAGLAHAVGVQIIVLEATDERFRAVPTSRPTAHTAGGERSIHRLTIRRSYAGNTGIQKRIRAAGAPQTARASRVSAIRVGSGPVAIRVKRRITQVAGAP